jgi:hypothetical protein
MRDPGRMPGLLRREARAVKIVREAVFFTVSAAVILPAPTLLWAWVTGKTFSEVMYR